MGKEIRALCQALSQVDCLLRMIDVKTTPVIVFATADDWVEVVSRIPGESKPPMLCGFRLEWFRPALDVAGKFVDEEIGA